MHVLLALVLALVTPAPHAAPKAPVPTPTPAPTYGGIMLGEPVSKLVADRGEPMTSLGGGEVAVWMYFSPGGGSMEMIGIGRGYVTGVGFIGKKQGEPAIPEDIVMDGVHLGGAYSDVPADAKEGSLILDGVVYNFKPSKDQKTVVSVAAHLQDDAIKKLPPLTSMPLLHDGSSTADAVVIQAPTEALAVVFEGGYMAGHDYCNPGKWKLLKRSSTQGDKKTYDVLDTGCDNSDKTKTLYFDVTTVPAPTATPSPK